MIARGQAIVETALGLVVFITLLVFCIHFAEVGALSIKLREASAGALWDTTAKKLHELPGEFGPLTREIAGAGATATGRYQDFDGRSSRDQGKTVTQVFTRGTALTVTCAADPVMAFAPDVVRTGVLSGVYADRGGMACSARATLSAWRFPRSLFKGSPRTEALELCAPGRGGLRCGTVSILLDDWGLAGPEESAANPLNDCSRRYCRSVQRAFDANGGVMSTAAAALAVHAVGVVPPLPTNWVSYRGEDEPAPFTEPLYPTFPMDPGPPAERPSWPTTPGEGSPVPEYAASYSQRSTCFLGAPCR